MIFFLVERVFWLCAWTNYRPFSSDEFVSFINNFNRTKWYAVIFIPLDIMPSIDKTVVMAKKRKQLKQNVKYVKCFFNRQFYSSCLIKIQSQRNEITHHEQCATPMACFKTKKKANSSSSNNHKKQTTRKKKKKAHNRKKCVTHKMRNSVAEKPHVKTHAPKLSGSQNSNGFHSTKSFFRNNSNHHCDQINYKNIKNWKIKR